MPTHTQTKAAANREATKLHGHTQPHITAQVGDRIARAHLLEGDAHLIALDTVARLITELRERGTWPTR